MLKVKCRVVLVVVWLFLLAQWNLISQSSILQKQKLNIGETIKMHSHILSEDRLINVYLPQGYASDSTKHYHIIYLLDGSLDEDFIHIAGLVQFGNFPWAQILPESIVVGIANVDRKRDFTYPTSNAKDQKDFPTSGGSEDFIRFIAQELMPLIEREYQSNSTSTIIGQSLGGLLATEILYDRPELFTNYMIISPSLWWDNESLLLHHTAKPLKAGQSVYVAVGGEGELMKRVAQALYGQQSSKKELVWIIIIDSSMNMIMATCCMWQFTLDSKTSFNRIIINPEGNKKKLIRK